ncbi:MAG TPA: acetoacetate--CoA ligase [Gemmatimonadaceae bacterium]|nr:acetoacetate--CoA ligase [Gemmatimonadaceae bacterium]
MSTSVATEPLWKPSQQRVESANMTRFIRLAAARGYLAATGDATIDYRSLWDWSVADRERFWLLVWEFGGIMASDAAGVSDDTPGDWPRAPIGIDRMAPPDPELGPRWFPWARLNFAENLLRYADDRPAIVFWNEEGRQRELSFAEVTREAAKVATALSLLGVGEGDRVAGFMPNLPETMIAMLGATWLGAIWSSCSPDFGVQGVLDRFGQIQPKVLFCADGYRYAGKEIRSLDRVRAFTQEIPSLQRVVVVSYRKEAQLAGIANAVHWNDFLAGGSAGAAPPFERLPFDHPAYIMYSSGTTGLPKCMVHGAGGTLIQHLKEHLLHTDITRDDKVFYFTTCGWMMWNWLVSSLAAGATLILYDGAPFAPRTSILWDMAASERVTVFGTSAKYLALCEKEELEPARTHDLPALRAILSTGSPLATHSFDYVYRKVKGDVHLASITGGTDLISCFALGNPLAPVFRGEIQARGLGMAVEVFDDAGQPVRGAAGELVCRKPFPSMPVAFWNDPNGEKYHAAYFDHFPGVWRHGDWAELTTRDGLIVYGRSDATLNPGGVRIGTAEIYRQVEQLPEIVESVAVGQEIGAGDDRDVRIVLFVRLRNGASLDDPLRGRIREQIRDNASPLHVPRVIVQVTDIPRTVSGKISEIAVRDVIHGRAPKNTEALANPEALALYRDLTELTT